MNRLPASSVTARLARFEEHLQRHGLKRTGQRDQIARVFFDSAQHVSVDELYRDVKQVNPGIGYATVYRTVKLLVSCGLASESHFRDGEARYENADEEHHDHLICTDCGRIVEFEETRIEELQTEVARRLGFELTGHRMELYGLCRDCRKPATSRRLAEKRTPNHPSQEES